MARPRTSARTPPSATPSQARAILSSLYSTSSVSIYRLVLGITSIGAIFGSFRSFLDPMPVADKSYCKSNPESSVAAAGRWRARGPISVLGAPRNSLIERRGPLNGTVPPTTHRAERWNVVS